MNENESNENESTDEWPIISQYTRAQALADGELVDVSATTREAGIKYPVALTREAWALCVALSPAAERAMNDEAGRLWDVAWMLANAARHGGRLVMFQVACVTTRERPTLVELKAICGPGDNGEPVITVMMPHES